jgi:hypothetical protein
VSTIEELLGRHICGSDLENRDYGRRGSVTLTTWHPLSAKVGTNFTGKGRSRTKATEILLFPSVFVSFPWYGWYFFTIDCQSRFAFLCRLHDLASIWSS